MTKPTAVGLQFYPASHRYKLSGEWVPGVTTILGVLNKPGLVPWAAGMVAEFVADEPSLVDLLKEKGGRDPAYQFLRSLPNARRDDAAGRGTDFHDFAERIANGEEVDVPADQVPLVESALAFMSDYDIEPELVEAVVGSREHRYAGKADLVANGAIWDWKSGKRIYASAAFQLTAYAFAEFHGEHGDEKPMPPIKAAYGVHIREDGYDVLPLEFGQHVFEEFLAIRRAYDINKRAEGNYRVPGSGYVGVPVSKDVA